MATATPLTATVPAPATLAALAAELETRLPAYLDDLRLLAAIDSGSYDATGVNAIHDWLAARLAELGFTVTRHAGDTLGCHLLAGRVGASPRRILLLGHADTVYPAGTASVRPMRQEGAKLLGPGTCDMKAGLLTGLYALAALDALDLGPLGAIHFLSVGDEEIDARSSIPLIRETARNSDIAFTLEAARANGDIVTARKTMRWCTVEATGRSAHAGVEPEQGRNAIVGLASLLVELDKLNGLRPGVTVNVGTVTGGTVANVVPDRATARLDLRAWTAADMAALLDACRATVDGHHVADIRFRFTDDEYSVMPALERTPAVAQLEATAQAIAAALGFGVNGAATGGASDASWVAAEGTPVLDGLGPVGGLDHSPDEYIELASIVPRTALLAGLLLAVSAPQSSQSNT